MYGLFLFAFAAFLGDAGEAPSPVWVTFDSEGYRQERRLELLQFRNEYLSEARKVVIDLDRLQRVEPFLSFDHPNDFRSIGGTAVLIHKSGKLQTVRFQTIASRDHFEKLLEKVVVRTGDGAIVERNETGDEVSVSNPEFAKRLPNGGVLRKNPRYLAFSDGICGWAGQAVLASEVRAIKLNCSNVPMADWGFYSSPSEVARESRNSFQSLLARELGVQKQQRDGEPDAVFLTRRAWVEQSEWFLTRSLSDIERVTFWMDDPRSEEPSFRAHLKVDLVPESSLCKMVASMRTNSVAERNKGVAGNSLVEADVALTLPKEIRDWISALVKQRVSSAQAAESLHDWISDGLIDVSLGWNCDDGGRSSFEGTIYSPLPEEKLDYIVSTMGINAVDRIMPISLLEPDVGLDMRNVFLRMWGRTGDIQFTIRSDDHITATTTATDVPQDVTRRPYSRGATMTIKGNLNPLMKWKRSDNVDVLRWLEYLERLYEYERTQKSAWFLQRTGRKPLQLFESIQPSLKADYDLNFDFKLQCSPDGESITADLRVSRDLYGLFLARKRLTERSIFLLPKKNQTLAP